jgi:hypothetical protein
MIICYHIHAFDINIFCIIYLYNITSKHYNNYYYYSNHKLISYDEGNGDRANFTSPRLAT